MATLTPSDVEETARYHRRHRRAHQRGYCACDAPPPSDLDGFQVDMESDQEPLPHEDRLATH